MIAASAILTPDSPSPELAEVRGLPLVEVRQRTTGAERCIAYRLTDPKSAMWGPMTRLFEQLVATDPTSQYGHHYATSQGVFSEAELSAAEARYTKLDDGRLRILFPIRHPWRTKPDDKGEGGERGVPVYADSFEERFDQANSTHKPEPSNRTYFDANDQLL